MVTQNMLRVHSGKEVFSEKKYLKCDWSRSNRMPLIGKNNGLPLTYAPISELPSYISTLGEDKVPQFSC